MSYAILTYILFLVTAFFGLGQFIQHKLNLKYPAILSFPIGLVAFLGFMQFIIYPIVQFKLSTWFAFTPMALILVPSFVFGLLELLKQSKNRKIIGIIVAWVLFLVWMAYLTQRQTLGQNTFDYTHYLSMVTHNANASYFGWTEYGSGTPINVSVQYDFQSFYAFGSFLLATYEPIQRVLSPQLFQVTSGLYIWVMTLLFYSLEFTLLIGWAMHLKKDRQWIFIVTCLIILGYFAAIYYNIVFAFFGNTYRTWLVAFLMFEVFENLKLKDLGWKRTLWIMLLSSALISVSSSGFFMGVMVLIGYVILLLKSKHQENQLIVHLSALTLPTALFALYYLGRTGFSYHLGLVMIYGLLGCSTLAPTQVKTRLIGLVKWLIWAGLPIAILAYSVYATFKGYTTGKLFFEDHRAYDMVWYFFNHEDMFKTSLNAMLFVSLIWYVIKGKSSLSQGLLVYLVLFINPINVQFVFAFLANVVYYRSFEIIFNPFTILMLFSFVEDQLPNRTMKLALAIVLMIGWMPSTINHSFYYYHDSFIPDEDYNQLYKMEESQIEPLAVLKTKIELEGYHPAMVISQIETVLSSVPNASTLYSNEVIRSLDKFSVKPEKSKLLNIFVVRDYIGQKVFDKVPDYDNTCNYLLEEKVDFVIVDKTQYYVDSNGVFTPLHFRVRDCATQIYENERYFIYQFYWK